jgi:thioredoxin reductase (NADPH)
MSEDKEVIIIGAGAAGLSAAQYAARANLKTLVIEELASGGQALIIDRLENYPGFPEAVTGFEFAQKMELQARIFGAEFLNTSVVSVNKVDNTFHVTTNGCVFHAPAVIIATGARHKKLNVPGENEYAGKGISYCATCDGPLFRNKKMLVVGGGDAACDESMFLAKLTDKILLIHRRDRFRAQKSLAARVLANPHITVRFNTELKRINGDTLITGAELFENLTNRTYTEAADAVFIFIGSVPQTAIVPGVKLDANGYIVTDHRMETSIPGLYAVGDVRATPFRQLVVAAGEGAIAAHAASQYIDERGGRAYL